MKKNTENKLFLGAGDINIINVVAQKNQILIFNSYLSKFNASIAYDVFENPELHTIFQEYKNFQSK